MDSKFATMPRIVVCSVLVGVMAFGLFGCAKKEAEQAKAEETPTEDIAAMPEMMPAAVGTYMVEIGEAGMSQKITVMLHEDNTAMLTVDYMNGQPATTQNGTWSMGENEGVVNFTYGSEGTAMTMAMTLNGDNLTMDHDMAAAMGVPELVLVRQNAAEPVEESHEGHNH
jgi:hypothetical protein